MSKSISVKIGPDSVGNSLATTGAFYPLQSRKQELTQGFDVYNFVNSPHFSKSALSSFLAFLPFCEIMMLINLVIKKSIQNGISSFAATITEELFKSLLWIYVLPCWIVNMNEVPKGWWFPFFQEDSITGYFTVSSPAHHSVEPTFLELRYRMYSASIYQCYREINGRITGQVSFENKML